MDPHRWQSGLEASAKARLRRERPTYSKHPGEPMKNILFALRHPLFYWRHYKAMRGFDRLFGPYGKAPF